MPTVSVMIPTYKRAAYIQEAVESVQVQTFRDFEIIVVDDGSPDHTGEIVEAIRQKDNRIKYIRKANGGWCSAQNAGLAHATGKYIAFLDDDDRWLPEKLKVQVDFMELHPEVGFCYTRFQIYRKTENGLEKGKLFPELLATKFEEVPWAFIAPSSVMLRKSCLDKTGLFNPQYQTSGDFDFFLRFSQWWPIAPIDESLTFTVMDGREHSTKDPLAVDAITIVILKNLELAPQHKRCKRYIASHIALRKYDSGRICLDRGDYQQAAKYFVEALLIDPLVGLIVRRPGEWGFLRLAWRVLKAYVAVPACLLKGLLNGRH